MPITAPDLSAPLHVAVGVVERARGEILIARRPHHLHQGGLWEFPGGKVARGERVEQALRRELQEELGIVATACAPLLQLQHDYGDRCVWLDVWLVTAFDGVPEGREGQLWCWAAPAALAGFRFPAANAPILHAIAVRSRVASGQL